MASTPSLNTAKSSASQRKRGRSRGGLHNPKTFVRRLVGCELFPLTRILRGAFAALVAAASNLMVIGHPRALIRREDEHRG